MRQQLNKFDINLTEVTNVETGEIIKRPEVEEWRNVTLEEWEGFYEVSNWGRVRSNTYIVNGEKLILSERDTNGQGYSSVRFKKGSLCKYLKIHRLVALAFLPNPDNLPQVNRKNENKSVNWVTNLEWCSASDNCKYGTRGERISKSLRKNTKNHERLVKMFTEMNVANGYDVVQLDLDGNFISEYPSLNEAARQSKSSSEGISKCCKGKQQTHKGFRWMYKEDYEKFINDNQRGE